MTLTIPPPPKPAINGTVPADHPWARYWCAEAIRRCKVNGARWMGPRVHDVSGPHSIGGGF